jgi:hypothetical protein
MTSTYLFVNNAVQSGMINNSVPTSSTSNYIVINNNSTPAVWSPLNLGTALVGWYRADMHVTSSGGVVSAWGDSSGNSGPTFSQATSVNRPTLNVADSQYNNQNSISFLNTAPQYLAQATAFSPTLSEPYTLISIGNGAAGFGVQTLIGDSGDNYVNTTGYQSSGSTIDIDAIFAAGTITGDPVILFNEFNDPNSTLSLTAFTPAFSGETFGVPTQPFFFGGGAGGTFFSLKGKIVEVLVINRVMTSTERTNFLAYAGALYNISIGP